MSSRKRKHTKGAGLSPGTLVYTGEQRQEQVAISLFDYTGERLDEKQVYRIEECAALRSSPTTTWINIDGVHDVALIQKTGECFGIHPLVLEDIVNTDQRPKVEDYDQYLYIVLKMVEFDPQSDFLKYEQLSLIVAERFLLSLQEEKGDIFTPIRQRIRNPQGRIRSRSSDYLAYVLIDSVVDHYFLVVDYLEHKISALDEKLSGKPPANIFEEIHLLKREILHFRKCVSPLREVLHELGNEDVSVITDQTRIFLRDVHDHTVHVVELIDIQRDTLTSMAEFYLSRLNSKMNEVMKTLTIISSIFIPLTFIVGVYGMNFRYLPELEWQYGYALIWGIMLTIVASLLMWFRHREWI